MSKWVLKGVWDFSISGATASPIDFHGLTGAQDILVIADKVASSVAVNFGVQISTDGSTFYNTTGNYWRVNLAGVKTDSIIMRLQASSASAAARSGRVLIEGASVSGIEKVTPVYMASSPANFIHALIADTLPIKSVRIALGSAGNFTGGKFYVLARMPDSDPATAWEVAGHWAHSVSGNANSITFDNLDDAQDLQIVVANVTRSANDSICMQLSDDNGASFYSTSGDYAFVSADTGFATNDTRISLISATVATAAYADLALFAVNLSDVPIVMPTLWGTTFYKFGPATHGPINAVRVFTDGANMMNSGDIYCLVRR